MNQVAKLHSTRLRKTAQASYLAAWDLLDAIQDLFPVPYAELANIGRALDDERGVAPWDQHKVEAEYGPNRIADAEFQKRVQQWTTKYGLSCPTVDHAASQVAAGQTSPDIGIPVRMSGTGQMTRAFDPPRFQPPPPDPQKYSETEYVEIARRKHREAEQAMQSRFKNRPHKLQDHHFDWLAAYLVGGYSPEAIANGLANTATSLDLADESTVRDGIRRVASLIGLTMRKPGPKVGSEVPRIMKRRS